ncbi:MAG: alpha/beta fold hydrolase [Dehalococcoidia bacterium]
MKRLLALGLAAGGAATAFQAMRRMRPPVRLLTPQGRDLVVNGARIHIVDRGAGDPIVLVHGFGGSTFSWRYAQPLLAANHRTIAVDLPGFGQSDRNPAVGLGHDDHADRLAALLDAVGLRSATFIGHSMGGAICQRLAVRHPERVDRLVLVASVDATEPVRRGGRGAARPAMKALAAIPGAVDFMSRQSLKRMVFDPASVTPAMAEGYAAPLRLKGTADCLFAMTRATATQAPPELSNVNAPTLVISGERDRLFSQEAGKALAAKIPGARHVVIPQTGHLVAEELPEAFVEEVVAFLTEPGPARL